MRGCSATRRQEALAQLLLLRVERAHYAWLAQGRGGDYTWENYLDGLLGDEALLQKLLRAYRDCVRRIDFIYLWCSGEIPETEFLRKRY